MESWPELDKPRLVVAFTGWIDAGLAGAGAVATLLEQLDDPVRFASIDLEPMSDLQQARPTVKLIDGITRGIVWPSIEFVAGHAGRDVVVCAGPEPSLHWRSFSEEIVDVARRLGVDKALLLGGLPSAVSHRRPVRVIATATSHSVLQEAGPSRLDYEGPTGAQTVLQVALGEAGIPAIGMWAEVPHYVAGNQSPPAIRSLLARLAELSGVETSLDALDAESKAYTERVEEGLRERPDVAAMVSELDEAGSGEIPSGDEIASEIEQFLREER